LCDGESPGETCSSRAGKAWRLCCPTLDHPLCPFEHGSHIGGLKPNSWRRREPVQAFRSSRLPERTRELFGIWSGILVSCPRSADTSGSAVTDHDPDKNKRHIYESTIRPRGYYRRERRLCCSLPFHIALAVRLVGVQCAGRSNRHLRIGRSLEKIRSVFVGPARLPCEAFYSRLHVSGLDSQTMPHTSISPMLSVRRGAKAVEFYKSAFGANVVYRVDAPDGAVVARLSADGAEFWVADESPEHKNFSPETLAGGTVRMVMMVDDPDAAFAKAIAAGATVVWPVGNQHGWRVGRVVDPFGHHWEIGKPVS
jgi:PhnB protein